MIFETGGKPVFSLYARAPEEAPAVVFLHGAGQDHSIWTLPRRYFYRHGHTVAAPDLPGHGRSAGPPLNRIETLADWVAEFMTAAGIGRAALVGHSMGSLMALACAARHPERVRAIALVGTAVPMQVSEALLDKARGNDHDAIDMLTYWSLSKSAQRGGSPTPGMWMAGGGLRLLERAAPGVLAADLEACNTYTAGLEHAAAVRCPALLILGERDIMTPRRNAARLAAEIPEARSVVLPGSGHALLAERPDPVLDALIGIV